MIRLEAKASVQLRYQITLDPDRNHRVILHEPGRPPREIYKKRWVGWIERDEAEAIRRILDLEKNPRPVALAYRSASCPDYRDCLVIETYRPGIPPVVIWKPDPRGKPTRFRDPHRDGFPFRATLGYPYGVPFQGSKTTDPAQALKQDAFPPEAFRFLLPFDEIAARAPQNHLRRLLRFAERFPSRRTAAAVYTGLRNNPAYWEDLDLQRAVVQRTGHYYLLVPESIEQLLELEDETFVEVVQAGIRILSGAPAQKGALARRIAGVSRKLPFDQAVSLLLYLGADPEVLLSASREEILEVLQDPCFSALNASHPNPAVLRWQVLLGEHLGHQDPVFLNPHCLPPATLETALIAARHRGSEVVLRVPEGLEDHLLDLGPAARQALLALATEDKLVPNPLSRRRELEAFLLRHAPNPAPLKVHRLMQALPHHPSHPEVLRWFEQARAQIGKRQALELLEAHRDRLNKTTRRWLEKMLRQDSEEEPSSRRSR